MLLSSSPLFVLFLEVTEEKCLRQDFGWLVTSLLIGASLLLPSDICVAPESQGGFEREQIREQLGGFIGHLSMGRLRRFLSGILYGNPFRGGATPVRLCSGALPPLMEGVFLQGAKRLRSSHTPTPTWTTRWPTTTRRQPA